MKLKEKLQEILDEGQYVVDVKDLKNGLYIIATTYVNPYTTATTMYGSFDYITQILFDEKE